MFCGFDGDVAKEYGVAEAILIKNFQYWLLKHKAEGRNTFDGHIWTYNSVKGWCDLFPFWTQKQIRKILEGLVSAGVLIKGNYNATQYDRTCWYAFADEEKWLEQNGEMDLPKRANGFAQNGKPIPDNIPDNNIIKEKKINKRKEKDFHAEVLAEMLEIHLNNAYNRKFTTNDWYKQMELLIQHDGIEFERARDVMNWHFENLDRKYCHVILSARSFREKFLALETQMKRNQTERLF